MRLIIILLFFATSVSGQFVKKDGLFVKYGDLHVKYPTVAEEEESPITVNSLMGRGLCARYITPNDGTGDFLWTSQQLDDFEAEQIDNVRAVFWYFNDSGSPNYTITPSVLTNLGAMIDSVNAHGMIFILDHHQPMMKRNNLYTQTQIDRFTHHWAQVAEYCNTRWDSTELVYELMNEPEYRDDGSIYSPMTEDDWYVIQQDAIDSIRAYDTDKSIMISGWHWSHPQGLREMVVPDDPSDRMILSIHYYNPTWMTKQGVTWVTWASGTRNATEWLYNDWPNIEPFWNVLEDEFEIVRDFQDDNPEIEVTVGEWGTVNGDIHTPHRYNYALMLANYFIDEDYSFSWWDDAGSFGIYDDGANTWDDSMVDAIFYDDLPGFGSYSLTTIYESDFSTDTDGWGTSTSDGGAVSLSVSGGQLVANVTNGGVGTDDVQIYPPTHSATKDSIFRVSYTISGTKAFCADKLNNNFNWHNIYELDGGGTYSRTYTYEMAYVTESSNRVAFLIGASTGLFYVDDMKIERITLE